MVKEFVTERLKLIDLYPDKAKSIAEEYGLKEDEVELIRKGRVSSQPVIDRDARTVTNYISTDAIDRDNEVIEHKGVVLDDYVKNPIVPWAHNYHDLPIGKNLWIKSDRKGLVAKTYFAKHPFAEQVFDLYTEDVKGTGPVLKAWSVGFIPLKWKDAKNGDKDIPQGERSTEIRRTYKKWLLLEYSAVPVPSNPEALTLMVEKGLIKDKKLVKDIEEFITETEPEKRKVVIMTEEDLLSEVKKDESANRDLLEELCPICGDKKTLPSDKGFDCDWNGEDPDLVLKRIITKPEETDKEIRIPAKGQEGKHKDHPIRWMTVSEENGIKGLYCIKDKLIITYVFDKAKGWTMAKALKWMKDNGKEITEFINSWHNLSKGEQIEEVGYAGMEEQIELLLEEDTNFEGKGVIPFKETAKAPEGEKWDAGKEVRAAEVSDLKVMCTWFDSEEPDTKGSYKLPHHKADGHAVVWRAVAAAMAALLGARGGVAIPSGDKKGVYNHLVKEYKRFDKEPPELREYNENEIEYIDGGIDLEQFDGTAFEQYWVDTIKAFQEETETKRPDLQGNPSVWDIIEAIEGQLNIGLTLRRNWVCDLYPTKYPSGNCVASIREKETKYYLYPYTYEDGKISLGKPTELEQIYTPKKENPEQLMRELSEEIRALKEGRVLSGKNLKLVKDCREQMGKALELLDKLIVASEPPKEESILSLITESKGKDNKTDIDSLTKKDMPIIIEEVIKGLKDGMLGQRKEMQDLIDSKTGKVR